MLRTLTQPLVSLMLDSTKYVFLAPTIKMGRVMSGKCDSLPLDGTNIELEVKPDYSGEGKWKTFLCYPLEGPASEKESSELWNEARDESKLRYEDCLENWVDSTAVFGDALERASEWDSDSWLYYMYTEKYWSGDLPEGGHPWVWKICFRTSSSGYEYIYDAADGRYLHIVWLI